jgi:hypothetical protein
MLMPLKSYLRRDKRFMRLGVGCIAVVAAVVVLGFFVKVSVNYDLEGVYLLKGETGRTWVLTDSVYLGEEDRLLAGVDLPHVNPLTHYFQSPDDNLELQWNAAEGRGYIRNRLADGTVLMTNFSRYLDSQGSHTHGLFIGGAEPQKLRSSEPAQLSGSGMAWFNGKEWNHIWCNTNESIGSTISPKRYPPSSWTYLGSTIEEESARRIVLTSRHQVAVDGVPLRLERRITALAGEPAVRLEMKITNAGNVTGRYFYYYGDEPWLGEFGGSQGDVGWIGGHLVQYETGIDTRQNNFIGMADYGNPAIGEGRAFRNVANFIEWSQETRPDIAFFANSAEGFFHPPERMVPLQGDERSLGMYWWPRVLAPGARQQIDLTIGMAVIPWGRGLPHTPALHAYNVSPTLARPG